MRVFTLDSTLHDGTLGGEVTFGLEDRLMLARKLDEFGVDYIDAGCPGTGARDREFFAQAGKMRFHHARLAAFGRVKSARNEAAHDPGLKALLEAGTPAVILEGESWDLHVYRALHTDRDGHLHAIRDSVQFFKQNTREVIYNAGHFFDAYEANPEFALATIHAAHSAGADVICLCDTNGGTLPSRVSQVCREVAHAIGGRLGIHAHNDADLAVANTLAAVDQGFSHIQGCLNGYGARCGCANLCSVLPNLELKSGHMTVGREKLEHLTTLAHFVAELANLALRKDQPFVGAQAFRENEPALPCERLVPELVGAVRQPGSLSAKLALDPVAARLSTPGRRELLDRIQQKEHEGYDLAGADGSLELLIRETLSPDVRFFTVLNYEVNSRAAMGSEINTSASVTVDINDSVFSGSATGQGPLNALDVALRQCLAASYPAVLNVRMLDYKVRVLESNKGTASQVRVLIEWTDGTRTWSTAGVSDDVIAASWIALMEAIRLELLRLDAERAPLPSHVEDYSWAV